MRTIGPEIFFLFRQGISARVIPSRYMYLEATSSIVTYLQYLH